MECLNRFNVKKPIPDRTEMISGTKFTYYDENNTVSVPCGKCFACKMNKRSDWVIRLNEEAKKSSGNYFVTLTYNDQNLPVGDFFASLYRKDIPLFIKRLRKALNGSQKGTLKYYAIGEYGTKTKRPHYHILFLNTKVDKWDFRIALHNAWVTYNQRGRYLVKEQLGKINTGDVRLGSIKYVAGYIINDFYKVDNEFQERPFANMSKGLGLSYITPDRYKWHTEDYENRCYIPLESGYKAKMPKYLRERIFTDEEREIQKLNYLTKLNENPKSFQEKKDMQAIAVRRYFEKNKKAAI